MSCRQLSDIADVVMGQSPTGDHVSPKPDADGLPLLNGPTEFGPVHPVPVQWTDDPRKRSQAGDLLFCVRGSTTGRMNWADQEYAIGRGLAAIRGKSGFRNSFVRANIEYRLPSLLALSSGSTFPNVSRADIESIEVAEISVDDALKASLLIESIDDKIANNRALAADLEAIARAIFKSWFVDFDPVKAKMEGRAPAGMDADTAALFPDEFVESKLGLIPKGWEVGCLTDALELNPRYTLKKGVPAPYLEMSKVPVRGHVPDEVVLREFSSGTKFQNGDTLLARITPCLENGKAAHVDFLTDDQVGWGSTEFVVLRAKPPVPAYFGYLLCRLDVFREHAISSMTGTSGRQRVQSDSLARWQLALPGKSIFREFDYIIDPLRAKIRQLGDESQELAQLRDALLPRLISGKLRLPEAETVTGQEMAE